MKLGSTVIAAMLLLASVAQARDVQVTLRAEPSTVAVGRQFRLSVTVSGAMNNLPDARLENMGPFRVVGSSQSSRISIVNGQINATRLIDYTVVGTQEGTWQLGPAVVEYDNERYASSTVQVTVTADDGSQPPAGGGQPRQQSPSQPQQQQLEARPEGQTSTADGEVFIRGSVDKRRVYVGEQVTFTFGFYNRVRMTENPEYSEPTFKGFWKEEIDDEAIVSNRQVNGAMYRVQELRYGLFPTVAGEATIDPAKLSFNVRNVWDFFDRGRTVTLRTRPIDIEVRPLPAEGRPDDFSGAVGDFSVSASLDKSELEAGEALTLTVVIEGRGNVRPIEEPDLPMLEGFDIYESDSEVSVGFSGQNVQGRKTFTYVVVPRRAGEYNWPGVSLSFFDPRTGQYRRSTSDSLSFSVTPSGEQETVTYRLGAESVVAVGEDIRYIKENASAALDPEPSPLSRTVWFWMLHLLPAGAAGAALLYRRHRGRLLSDRGYARYRKSTRRAADTLKSADKLAGDERYGEAYAALNRALVHFIGDRLNVEATGMTADEIDGLLAGRDVPEEPRGRVREVLEHFSFVRFAPGTGADRDAYRDYRGRVGKLLDELGRKI